MAARSARGRKERYPFLSSMHAYVLKRLSSSLQLRPQGSSVRKWEGCLPLQPFSKGKALGTVRGCPPQTPATHSTLKSLSTLHLLGGANIRS